METRWELEPADLVAAYALSQRKPFRLKLIDIAFYSAIFQVLIMAIGFYVIFFGLR